MEIERAQRALHKALVRGLVSPDFARKLRRCGVRANSARAACRLAMLHGLADETPERWKDVA